MEETGFNVADSLSCHGWVGSRMQEQVPSVPGEASSQSIPKFGVEVASLSGS